MMIKKNISRMYIIMEDIALDLSPNQISKLRNGHRIQIHHNQIGGGKIKLKLPSGTINKLKKAADKMKSVRFDIDGDTIEMNGGALSWKKFKKGANKTFKAIGKVAKPVHKALKPILGPVVREGLSEGLQALGSSYGYDIPDPVADTIVNTIGNKTGGYGIHRKGRARIRGQGFHISNNHSHMLNGMHPAMHPPFVSMPDTSKPDYKNSGGRIGRPKTRPIRLPKGLVSIQNGGSFLTN